MTDEVQRQARRAHMIAAIERARDRIQADMQYIAEHDGWDLLKPKLLEIISDERAASDPLAVGAVLEALHPPRGRAEREQWAMVVVFDRHGRLVRRAIHLAAADLREGRP